MFSLERKNYPYGGWGTRLLVELDWYEKLSTRSGDVIEQWLNLGRNFHRLNDLPALINCRENENDHIEWFVNGQNHRDGDNPAIIRRDGTLEWFKEGSRHREGKPAVIDANGSEAWFINNHPHRDGDEPAAIWGTGTKEYYKHGLRHRDDDKPAVIDERRNQREWWWKGRRHREDGPAIIMPHREEWWEHGGRHRIGAPAIYRTDEQMNEEWWENGGLHRQNGPARTYRDYTGELRFGWNLRGKNYRSFNTWIKHSGVTPSEKILLHLKYK